MKNTLKLYASLAILMASAFVSEPIIAQNQKDLVPVGYQKQLLVDDYVIEATENITRELGHPEKYGVVIEPTLPYEVEEVTLLDGVTRKVMPYYEFGRRVTVVWNDHRQVVQLWYEACRGGTGYAESEDGVHFTKPMVASNGKTNLISHMGQDTWSFSGTSIMLDPTLPWGHPEKYKAAFDNGSIKCCIAYSADGIHWTSYNHHEPVTERAADTHNQILWDDIQERYLLLTRTDLAAIGGIGESRSTRIMAHEDNDLLNHPCAWKTLETVVAPNPKNETNVYGVPKYQMESMKIWTYENIYFNFMHFLTVGDLTGSENAVRVANPDIRPDADVIDFYIGTSRTGTNFDMSWVDAREPFIERGPDYAYDKSLLEPPTAIITLGDEHYIYYTALYNQHHTPVDAIRESGKVCLAKLPLDRFISQSAGAKMGTVTTKPFVLKGNALQVNVDVPYGEFFVEVLDAEGQPIEGFTAADAHNFKFVDQLRLEPYWDSHNTLSELQGQTIRLKFHLRNAKLYAFQVVNNY